MRPSLRFLALTMAGWVGVRAATVENFPAARFFHVTASEAKPPPIIATQFAPIEPLTDASNGAAPAVQYAAYPYRPQSGQTAPTPVSIVYAPSAPVRSADASGAFRDVLPDPRPHFYGQVSMLDDYPLSRIAASSLPPLQSSVTSPGQSIPLVQPKRFDRLQLSSWAMLRSQRAGVAGTSSLSSGGSLGASQAGARLIYNVTPQLSAVLRTSSEVGRRGGEVAAGVRVQPLRGLPVWLTAERRQRVGRFGGGRSAFALFFEGGVYDRPMPLDFLLDAYLQGGVVGLRRRDTFIDGGLTLTRPVYRQFAAGFGVWGGAQPGVYRVDAGPRVTMRVRGNMKVHVDWRQRLAGKALPGSGPAVTLAGDF